MYVIILIIFIPQFHLNTFLKIYSNEFLKFFLSRLPLAEITYTKYQQQQTDRQNIFYIKIPWNMSLKYPRNLRSTASRLSQTIIQNFINYFINVTYKELYLPITSPPSRTLSPWHNCLQSSRDTPSCCPLRDSPTVVDPNSMHRTHNQWLQLTFSWHSACFDLFDFAYQMVAIAAIVCLRVAKCHKSAVSIRRLLHEQDKQLCLCPKSCYSVNNDRTFPFQPDATPVV